MAQFVKDSYNGLYKVLLKPYIPRGSVIMALIGGVIIGLFWAYVVSPTVFYDADPSTLHQSWQDEWVKLIADRYAASNFDVDENVTSLLSRVDNPLEIVDRLLATPGEEANQAKLQAIRPFAEAAETFAVSAPSTNALGNIVPYILAPIIATILFVLGAIVYGMFIQPNLVEPLIKRLRGERTSDEVKAMKAQVQAAKQAEATSRSDFSTSSWGPPLMQRMSTYLLGHGQYDDSFTIEDAQSRFLGECGAEKAESIGVGDPPKAPAVVVWLFDKDDVNRTVTKVFCSEHAYNDPALRARLELKGDLVLVQPGATMLLETATLRVQARVVDLEYGTGPMPTNSYFKKLTIELAAWHKGGADSSAASVPALAPLTPPLVEPVEPVTAMPTPTVRAPAMSSATPVPAVTRPMPAVAPVMPSTPPAQPPTVARPPLQAPGPVVRPPVAPPTPAARPPIVALPDDDPFGGDADF